MYVIEQQLPASGRWLTVAIVGKKTMADMVSSQLMDSERVVWCRVRAIGQSEAIALLTSWQPSATVPS